MLNQSAYVGIVAPFAWCLPPSPLQVLADRFRLRITRAEDGEPVIRGRRGCFYLDGEELGLTYLGDECTARGKKALLAAGPHALIAEGDRELLLLPGRGYDFDQAIRVLGVPRRRRLSLDDRLRRANQCRGFPPGQSDPR